MRELLIRLDDACEYRNQNAWLKTEQIMDVHGVKPLVGIIPCCKDPELCKYPVDVDFWTLARQWQQKKWSIAMHGYDHVYITKCGGINPINQRSEFADVDIKIQIIKIKSGIKKLKDERIIAKSFFSPSHTFDENTLKALEQFSDIRRISDCIANRPYNQNGFEFFPQQTGRPRNLPMSFVTVCLHPNTMTDVDFDELDSFLKRHREKCIVLDEYPTVNRYKSFYDYALEKTYFVRRNFKHFSW